MLVHCRYVVGVLLQQLLINFGGLNVTGANHTRAVPSSPGFEELGSKLEVVAASGVALNTPAPLTLSGCSGI